MHDSAKIIFGLILFVVVVTYPAWHNAMNDKAGFVPAPKAPPDKKECIEPKQVIRVIHKDLLADWKESVVRRGVRTYLSGGRETYTMSLTGTCMNCHRDKAEFCDQCHNYMGVKPRCWDCHAYPKEVESALSELDSHRKGAEVAEEYASPLAVERTAMEKSSTVRANGEF
jgi:hypothetical protein